MTVENMKTCSYLFAAVAAMSLLAACSTSSPPPATTSGASQPATPASQIAGAATAPLNDLNLVRADIPPVLAAARRDPYLTPDPLSCDALGAGIHALDEVLGADLDTPPTPGNPGLIERGTSAAGNAAVGALRGAAEGVVPFRGWVRKLTGAERYSREVAASIAAGTVRRAYLKGLGLARGCTVPAAPRRAEK